MTALPKDRGGAPPPDFADLFDHAPVGLVEADRHCRIVHANATLAEILGRASDACTGLHFSELLTMGSRLYFETHFAPMLRMSGRVREIALDLAGADGARIPVLVNAAERRDQAGGVLAVALAVFPAEDRRQYERNLLAQAANAEGAASEVRATSDMREQLLAILGHELRNPLAAISSGLGLLKRENAGASARAQRVTGLMEASVIRASVLIENVLDFARGRLGGGIELNREASKPLAPVLEQVAAELRLVAPGRAIVTAIDLPSPVAADHARIGQLVSNLLGNALTHGAPDQPVRLEAAIEHEVFELSVANAGEPISEEMMANLFRPFFRGQDNANKQGLGLGLHIASEIAKAHGGTLTVASNSEETRFTFRMPLGGDAGLAAARES
jgi:sigma-B regulation protein RsbU (phosphoserine phosphatase)